MPKQAADLDAVSSIERSLVRIRRSQQANRLHRSAGPTRGADPGAARYRYLDALEELPRGCAISDVATAIGVDRPRASRLTAELVGAGLIERLPGDDARTASVRLTTAGRRIVNQIRRTRAKAVARALADLTLPEQRQLARLLGRFVDAWPA